MLSIVIPTYNEEKYLPKLLASLKKQTYQDFEIIVADNNSTDKTREIIRKSNCRFTKGGYPPIARNNGAKIAKHDLLFLDADVIVKDKEFLKNFLKKIKENELDIATCKVLPYPKRVCATMYYFAKNYLNKYFGYVRKHASGQCIFIKKELFDKINGYDEFLLLGEEHDLAQRASKLGKFYFFMDIYVHNSPRRIEKEGCFGVFFKNGFSELYRLFGKKVKKKIINYDYEYSRKH